MGDFLEKWKWKSDKFGWGKDEFDWEDYQRWKRIMEDEGEGEGSGGSPPLLRRFLPNKTSSGKQGLLTRLWKGEGFSEGSFAGVPSDPSGTNIDMGGGGVSDWFSGLFGGGESGGAGSGVGAGALGWAAVIAGAIFGQWRAGENIEREFEGQEGGSALSGSFFTEPWYAKLTEQWGWDITPGEKMDAAVKNGDWGTALRRLPEAADYWVNPLANYAGDFAANQWGPLAEGLVNPVGLITSWFD